MNADTGEFRALTDHVESLAAEVADLRGQLEAQRFETLVVHMWATQGEAAARTRAAGDVRARRRARLRLAGGTGGAS